jgi:hypothetical protein
MPPLLSRDVRFPLVAHSRTDLILHQILMLLAVPEGRQGPTETSCHQPSNPFPGKWKDLGNGHRSLREMDGLFD